MTKIWAALLVAGVVAVAGSAASFAYSKCYHCYVNDYGKKVCHDICSCKGTH